MDRGGEGERIGRVNTRLDASDSSSTTDRCASCSCVRMILCATRTFDGATKAARGLSHGGS